MQFGLIAIRVDPIFVDLCILSWQIYFKYFALNFVFDILA